MAFPSNLFSSFPGIFKISTGCNDSFIYITDSQYSVTTQDHLEAAHKAIRLISEYRNIEDLLQLGAYTRGTDPKVDEAVDAMPQLEKLLRQDRLDSTPLEETIRLLKESVQVKGQRARNLSRLPGRPDAGSVVNQSIVNQ